MTDASPSSSSPPPRTPSPSWWPMLTSGTGLVMCLYEMFFDRLDRPYVIGAGVSLALGGKIIDVLRSRP